VGALVTPELEAKAIAWRRRLHANPELSYEEVETSQLVFDELTSIGGLELERPTPTSVVARLLGDRPGATLALRADMDALPIQEENTFEFASVRPGVMHACGHDGHTAMLLAAATLLTGRRQELAGEVRFVFQHAEEKPPGGAGELVAAGVIDGADAIVGAHLTSGLEVGKVAIRSGAFMAAADTFEIEIRGSGGHAALPQRTVDPIAIAAQAVNGLQQIVSRETDPLESVVVSVTRIEGGTTDNVIPERVALGGTVRTFSAEARTRTQEAIERVLRGVTLAHRADFSFTYREGYAPVINDHDLAAVVEASARAELGDDAVVTAEPKMAGEDFSAYQKIVPGVFFNVGAANEAMGVVHPNHHPRFTIDESALAVGISVLARTALDICRR
jgi:amidohydrolase